MALTPEQGATLETAMRANPALAQFVADRRDDLIAAYYNEPSSPAYTVWKTSVATGDLFDAIQWANLTPSPAPDGTAAWTNRSLACQGKQFNLQTILTGRGTINPSKVRIRNGLQDSLTDVPSGNNGALRTAGWDQVLLLLYRTANRCEALFATGAGTTLAPSLLTFEGEVQVSEVSDLLNRE